VTRLDNAAAVASVLDGTPYSLPPEADDGITEMRERMTAARVQLQGAIKEAGRIGLVREMDRSQAYWTVFESNSIEFAGPDLGGTVTAIESSAGQSVIRNLNVTLLPELLRQDRLAFAAVGLETARVLTHRYIGEGRRGVRQVDLRSLHSIVLAGSIFAGKYRSLGVKILDQEHIPFMAEDIPHSMADFADWSARDVPDDLAVLRAAVGHAWFTHVHPFYDGNGRVSRLVTNVMLGQDSLPPPIVKAKAQRSRYIAALAHSDEGGDIMPLTGLFLETIERYVQELSRPETFLKLFDQLVARRGDNYFDWYRNCIAEFMDRFRIELELVGLRLWPLDEMTREMFSGLRHGMRHQSVLAAVVVDDQRRQELALYHRSPSHQMRLHTSEDQTVPMIAFARPNDRYALSAYRRTTRAELEGLSAFWVQPDRPTRVCVSEMSGVRALGVNDAASEIANRLRASFSEHFTRPDDYYGSARWLPKLNGGPG
jgi:fido (protein-threonine AMPylation protein)